MVKAAPDFTENSVRDGKRVTGQNPQSAAKAAALFVEAIRLPVSPSAAMP